MDIINAIRDWVVAGIIIYIAVRYGILRDQERTAMKAQLAQARGESAAELVKKVRDLSQYANKITAQLQEAEVRRRAERLGGVDAGILLYWRGVRDGMMEGAAAIHLIAFKYAQFLLGAGSLQLNGLEIIPELVRKGEELFKAADATDQDKKPTFSNIEAARKLRSSRENP